MIETASTHLDFLSDARETAEVIGRLGAEDAAALPLLEPAACARWRSAADKLDYRVGKREIGSGERLVRQDFDICIPLPAESPFHTLAARIEGLLNAALDELAPPPLGAPLRINDLVMQRYPAGSFGITAHRDHLRYVGLVALVILSGEGRFCVSADRKGTDAREVRAGPGSLLLMRAPGFEGRRDRPFHYLTDITEMRYSLGLRQDSAAVG